MALQTPIGKGNEAYFRRQGRGFHTERDAVMEEVRSSERLVNL
jgi:hypothetical protein